MVVRELVAMLGIDFDRSGVREADNAMKGLKDTMATIAGVVSFAAIGAGLMDTLHAASSVEETLNVVQQTFKGNTDSVLAWAKTTGDAMGRSQYAMREYVGQLGAILVPTLNNEKAATDMSKSVAGLAVDLASFFNQEDSAVLGRLRSGLLGSTEAVDQLGINLRAESIEAFNAERGIRKKFRTMTEAEKVESRYAKMIKDTADKQGDAARTSQSYANQTKKLEAAFFDLKVAIGSTIMGPAGQVVSVFASIAGAFKDVAASSGIIESALVTIGALALAFGVSFALANLPLLLFAAGIGAIVLLLNDFNKAMEGGKSVFGTYMKALLGEEEWKLIRESWNANIEWLGDKMYEAQYGRERLKKEGRKVTDSSIGIGAGASAAPGVVAKLTARALGANTKDWNDVVQEKERAPDWALWLTGTKRDGYGVGIGDVMKSAFGGKSTYESADFGKTITGTQAPIIVNNTLTVNGSTDPVEVDRRFRQASDEAAQKLQETTSTMSTVDGGTR